MQSKQSLVNLVRQNGLVTRSQREQNNGHRGVVIWFTGLSGSGKSTLAYELEKILYKQEFLTYVLDGDNIRHGLCSDLGFSKQDRRENIRRVAEVSRLFVEAGFIILTAFISPCREDRNRARQMFSQKDFIEVYCNASIDVCESRDVKGLYKKARDGEVFEFTGISSPYDVPEMPELILNTSESSINDCISKLINYISYLGVDKR